MKNRKGSRPKKGASRGKKFSFDNDPFFGAESRKRRKVDGGGKGDIIESSDSDGDGLVGGGVGSDGDGAEEAEAEEPVRETADEVRKRLAYAQLEKLRQIERKHTEEDEDDEEGGGRSGKEREEGQRDSLVAQILLQQQLEESGRVRRTIASR